MRGLILVCNPQPLQRYNLNLDKYHKGKKNGIITYLVLLFLIVSHFSAFAQNQTTRIAKILKQGIIFEVEPLDPNKKPEDLSPGDSLKFTYNVYTDKEAPTFYDSVRIKLTIRDFSETFKIPSLVPGSFIHLNSFRLKPNPDNTVTVTTEDFNPQLDLNLGTVLYTLGDVKLDTTAINDTTQFIASDTLAFEFSYEVSSPPDSALCIRLFAGMQDEFIYFNQFGIEQKVSGPGIGIAIDTESSIDWSLIFSPSSSGDTTFYSSPPGVKTDTIFAQAKDTLFIKINYKNKGNISDIGQFRITLPFKDENVEWNIVGTPILPPSASYKIVKTPGQDQSIEVLDSTIFAGEDSLRMIVFQIAYTIRTYKNEHPHIEVKLTALCDESAQNGEICRIPIDFNLNNLLSVQKSVDKTSVSPGDTMWYTISVIRKAPGVVMDSVQIIDKLQNTGISEIIYDDTRLALLDGFPPHLEWLLENFVEDTVRFTFGAVVRRDYHQFVSNDSVTTCNGETYVDSVIVRAIQDTSVGEIPEHILSDNEGTANIRINGPGDLMRLNVTLSPAGIVFPGDMVTFTVNYANINAFSPGGPFTLVNNLPNTQYAMLIPSSLMVTSGVAKIDSSANQIRVAHESEFAPGDSATLVFKLLIRTDIPVCDTTINIDNSVFLDLRGGFDCVTDNNSASTTIAIEIPNLLLEKSAAPASGTTLDARKSERVAYSLRARNNSNVPAFGVVVADFVPPEDMFQIDSISAGGMQVGDSIVWRIPQLSPNSDTTLTFSGTLANRLYCETDSLINIASVRSDSLACPPATARVAHAIAKTPPDAQPQLNITALFDDEMDDGLIEPNEPVIFCLTLASDSTVDDIIFRKGQNSENVLIATFGSIQIPLTLTPQNNFTPPLLPGNTAVYCDTFQAPIDITSDSLIVTGIIETDINCGQPIRFVYPTRGTPMLEITCSLADSSGNNLAGEDELITAHITLANTSSQFDAEDITLHLKIPARFGQDNVQIAPPNEWDDPNDITQPVSFLPPNNDTTWQVSFRYPDFPFQDKFVMVETFWSREGFSSGGSKTTFNSESKSCEINIDHPCYARPRTFIPEMHTNGLKFQPDENLDVFILDTEGNKVWEGNTNEAWFGKSSHGRALPPGTYIYVIKSEDIECNGTIILLR